MKENSAMSVSTKIFDRRCGWTRFRMAALIVAASLMVSCSSEKEKEVVPVVTVQAATVASKTIQATIDTDAILYPRDEAAIVPKVVAPIKKFYVQRGSQVRAGQLLAELENQDLVGALTENQGGYEQAEASYKSALQSASQDLQVAKEQLDAAQKLYDAREALFKQGAIAAKDVEDAGIALTQARDQYDLAQKAYNLKVAQGQLTTAKGKTDSAQAQLSYTKIVSPMNGVVSDRPYYAGETPASGSPILTVMDLSSVVARAYVSPQQAAELHVGDPASLSPGGGAPEMPGKVTVVSPAVDPNSTTVQVWVQAPNPGSRLKPGSTVSLSIVAKTVKDALVVPTEAILAAPDGTTSVMVIGQDGQAHQTGVKTGIRESAEVQILSGLHKGEQVVAAGAYGLTDGTKVTVSASPASGGSDAN
ncbi:MAG: efflux RND transporter periplasmic adaptor subunit [Candidatus Acidiferrales bacterium]